MVYIFGGVFRNQQFRSLGFKVSWVSGGSSFKVQGLQNWEVYGTEMLVYRMS